MKSTPALITEVRLRIGESLPEGGGAADTLFSDAQVAAWITEAESINHAIISGWEAKLAQWSNLVDVNDGASSRKLGDLMLHGEKMIAYYQRKLSQGPGDGTARSRSRVGRIIRHG